MSERNYSELVSTIIDSVRLSAPATLVRVGTLSELFDLVDEFDETSMFILTAEPQQVIICCDGDCHKVNVNQHSPKHHYIRFGFDNNGQCPTRSLTPITIRVDEFNITAMILYLERYFRWFGGIDTIFVLGSTVAVFKMQPFAVDNVLLSSTHEVPIPRDLVLNQAPSHVSPTKGGSVDQSIRIQFTVNRIGSDCLSLNGILSLLKYVDSQSVIMVRRVNRLGFNGSTIIRNFFEQRFGRVSRVFMLPLRSRKKNVNLPSKTGFVVMESRSSCAAILERNEYYIQSPGVTIAVGRFTHRAAILTTENDAFNEELDQ